MPFFVFFIDLFWCSMFILLHYNDGGIPLNSKDPIHSKDNLNYFEIQFGGGKLSKSRQYTETGSIEFMC